jgi:hypothetical protein
MMNILKLHDEKLRPEFTFADVQGQPTEVMNPDAIIHLAKTGGTEECHALYRAYRSQMRRRCRSGISEQKTRYEAIFAAMAERGYDVEILDGEEK